MLQMRLPVMQVAVVRKIEMAFSLLFFVLMIIVPNVTADGESHSSSNLAQPLQKVPYFLFLFR
jgi:hypothetical protein